MKNYVNSKGQLVRVESYEKDKNNMIASHFNGYWVVMNFGAKTKTKKKEIPVRQYKVTKNSDGIHCTCPSHSEKNEVCKHILKVVNKAKEQRETEKAIAMQEEEERTARIEKAIARW